jgi:glycine/D-amino acid oxidase-like deaminating enzyme
VSASETRRLEPRLGEEVYGGVVQLGTAQIDSYRMTLAFAQAAEQRGATVLNRNVTGLEREGSRVTGVQTDAGAIACDRVVLAMGAWSGEAERRLEFPVPVKPLKGQLIRMHYPGNDIRPEAEQLIGYVHMRRDGLLCCGSTSEPAAGFDTTPTEAARLQLLRFAARLMPCVVDSELVHQYGGPRPSPPDGTTVIGTVPGWEGVYLSVAAAGIQCCSLMGQIVCDLISDREPPVPIDTLVPEKLLKPLAEVYGWRKFLGEVFV